MQQPDKNRMRVKEQLTDPSSTITHIPQQLANDIQSQDFINKATEAIRRHLEIQISLSNFWLKN